MNLNNNIYPKTNSPAAPSVGRRLLHNRLRSIGATGQQQLSLSPSTLMMGSSSSRSRSSSSSAPRSPAPLSMTAQQVMSSFEEKSNCRAYSYERQTVSSKLNSTGKSSDGTYEEHSSSPGLTYSNLSVIPQLSSALFSCAPITALHLNSNAASNSPEANLRNLLLQQLLSSQQHQQLPSLQPVISATAMSQKSAVNDSSIAHFAGSSHSNTTWHNSSSLIDSMLTDSSCTCPNIAHKDSKEDKTSCCYADEHVSTYLNGSC